LSKAEIRCSLKRKRELALNSNPAKAEFSHSLL
jgi:hypothetical protein